MNKFKLGFLKSSASSSDKFSLDNTAESSCGMMPTPKFKRFFTLRRKRNDSQSRSQLIRDLAKGNSSASPPRTINRSAGVATAVTITTSTSVVPGNVALFHSQPQPQQSPPASIDASRQTGGSEASHFEMTERVETIEAFDSMEEYDQPCQKSESLGRRSLTEIMKTQEVSDMNSEISLHGTLSKYHSSASMSSKIADSPPLSDIGRHAQEEQRYEVSELRRVLEVLQRAAQRVRADQTISQVNIFRSLVPLAIFLYLLGIGVIIPRQQPPFQNIMMVLLFFVGMALVVVFLRGIVWLMSVFGEAFCEVDLLSRRGECVDVNGRGMGEAEMIVGGMFI